MVDRELVRFYFDTMSLNEHLTQWYRAILVAFHGGVVFAMFATWSKLPEGFGRFISLLVLVIIGLIVSLLWVWLTSQREVLVRRQMRKIVDLAEADQNLKECYRIYDPKMKWFRNAPPIVFNLVLPVLVGVLLIVMVMLYFYGEVCWIWCLVIGLILVVIFGTLAGLTYGKWRWIGVTPEDKAYIKGEGKTG